MRTDCTIDNRAVYCPNASKLGFGKYKAKRGDCIVYKQEYKDGSYRTVLARVLGRVTAPELSFTPEVKGWLLVMRLSDDGSHAYENWVDPADVQSVLDVPTAMLTFFAQPTLPEVHRLRTLMSRGYITDRCLAEGRTPENLGGVQS